MGAIQKSKATRITRRAETTVADKPEKTVTLTIRGVDERVRHKIKLQASMNGRSMEAEVRHILEEAVRPVKAGLELFELSQEVGGMDDLAGVMDEMVTARRGGQS